MLFLSSDYPFVMKENTDVIDNKLQNGKHLKLMKAADVRWI